MSNNYNFTSVQKQTSQLDCQFDAPLIKDFVVEVPSDLTRLDHNYPNKLIWVASEKAFYYLRDDSPFDGSVVTHWRKHGSAATISPYDSNKEYLPGECVYIQKKIYSAKTTVPAGQMPPNDNYWECIAGEIVSQKITITGDTTIDTVMDNPIVQVYDNNNMLVDCCVEILTTIGAYGFRKVKVSFESDGETTSFSGYVIIK